MTNDQPPRGRPPARQNPYQGIHVLLSDEVVAALNAISPGNRSAFIEAWLRTHPQVAEHLVQQQKPE